MFFLFLFFFFVDVFMADNILQLKRKGRGSDSSVSDIEVKSPEEKKARDARSKADSTSSPGDEITNEVHIHLNISNTDSYNMNWVRK